MAVAERAAVWLKGGRRADLQPVMHTYAGCLRLLIKLETAKKKNGGKFRFSLRT